VWLGVPCGLVDVDVDGHHEVQPVQGSVQARAVGRREHRLPARVSIALMALALGLDLLAQHRDRQLVAELRQPAHPALPDPVVTPADQPHADRVDGRTGEHRAADPVEVAGQDVEQVDRPVADGPELLG